MFEGSIAIRVKKILREHDVDEKLAEAIAIAIDDVYHKQFSNVATKDDIKMLIELMEKRFEIIDKRFEAMEKRFEDVNRRFEDMNKRFDDINKRFEELHNRVTFIQWLILFVFIVFSGIVTFITTWVLPQLIR